MHTILILDDEEKHLLAISEYLRSTGFNTLISTCPVNAFLLIKESQPDLLILDIMIPNMDGYAFIKKLNSYSYFPNVPFLFLTAKGMTQDRIEGYKLGCSGYISKPFDPDELIAMINNILGRNKQREEEIIKSIKQIKQLKYYLQHQYYLSDLNSLNLNLTSQEYRILNCLLKGLKNKEIADKLHTSIRNVEKYVTRLLNKTKTSNRTDLVRFIYLQNFNELTENPKANDGDRTRE
jgi:DNA-binding NarL/FixJ family response regulator